MLKTSHTTFRRFVLLVGCVLVLLAFIHINIPVTHAAGAGTITIAPVVGRPGTPVTITGSNFNQDGDLRLYTTANPGR